jgi:hypothetical protein
MNQNSQRHSASRRPTPEEWTFPYHGDLLAKQPGHCALNVLESQMYWLCELASHLSTEMVDKIHSPYTWTIRQVFEHGADAERIFGYRILRLAAGDTTPLAGWDENAYADARFGLGSFSNLVSEWGDLRKANLRLLRRIEPRCWNHAGEMSGGRVTLRAVAWITAAHLNHHFEIVQRRTGLDVDRSPPTPQSEPRASQTKMVSPVANPNDQSAHAR